MTRGRVVRAAAAIVWASAAAVWAVGPASTPAGAIAPDAYGWWAVYQQAPGGSNLPVPPGIPEDGIFVSGAPQTQAGQTVGVAAFGAVRARIGEGSPARILLSVAEGYVAQADAVVLACPTTSHWDPFVNGRWEARPTYDCVRGVQGTVSPTGDTVTFEMAGTAQKEPGLLDVAIVPGGPVRLGFQRPDPTSIQPAFEASGPGEEGDDTADSDDTSAFDPTFDGSTGSDGSFFTDGGALSLPVFAPDAPAPAAAPVLTDASPSVGLRQAFPVSVPLPLVDDRGERAMAAGLLLLMGAALWWFGGAQARAPRRLGSMGSAAVDLDAVPARLGGIGRFARARSGRPTRL